MVPGWPPLAQPRARSPGRCRRSKACASSRNFGDACPLRFRSRPAMTRLAYLLSLVALLWASGSSAARPCPWPLQQSGGGRVRRAAEPPQRVVLAPQFVPGRVLRYQMEIRTTTERSEEHTSELQSLAYLVCRLLLEK